MEHLIAVDEDGNRSHWVARAPMIGQVAWDAEIINERENELIAWRSLPGSELDTAGSVHFESAPGDRGTQLTISLGAGIYEELLFRVLMVCALVWLARRLFGWKPVKCGR